jgi:DNA-binding NtrC family response regulator
LDPSRRGFARRTDVREAKTRLRSRILVADDDELLCLTLLEILDLAGYPTPAFVTDGAQTIAHMRDKGADLVILDIIMPQREGIEVLIELKRDFPDTKVIAISGGGRLRYADNFLMLADRFGADMTLKKPITGTTILKCVDRLLANPPKDSVERHKHH